MKTSKWEGKKCREELIYMKKNIYLLQISDDIERINIYNTGEPGLGKV